jgi:hypothetical protein
MHGSGRNAALKLGGRTEADRTPRRLATRLGKRQVNMGDESMPGSRFSTFLCSAEVTFLTLSLLHIKEAGKKGSRRNTIAVVPALIKVHEVDEWPFVVRKVGADDVGADKATLPIGSVSEYPRPSHPLGVARAGRSRIASSARVKKNPFCDLMKDCLRPCRIVQIEQRSSGRRRYPMNSIVRIWARLIRWL